MLKGKVCLITGSNRGIGAEILSQFAHEEAIIYANARTEGILEEQSERLNKSGKCRVVPIYFDIRDSEAIKRCFLKIKKEEGKLDVLVNNAGIMKDAVIGMIDKHFMHEVFETNVIATVELLQYAARLMKNQKQGSIINFSSIVGTNGSAGQLVYSASKGAVVSITKTAAKELAPFGIRVNAVAPGIIDTDLIKSVDVEKIQKRIDLIAMKRMGTPTEVAKMVVVLASDYSSYVTGQVIGIDGGAII